MLKETRKQTGRHLHSRVVEYEQEPMRGRKARREDQKAVLRVHHNGAEFQADFGSVGYMAAVLAVANAKFNRLLSEGVAAADAYTQVYEQTIPWKDAHNTVQNMPSITLSELLEKSMDEVAKIIGAKA